MAINRKILCVDDDPNILQGYKRTLRNHFEIHTAEGGELGLTMIATKGPFAVIVSDMRMPGMDGVQFLSRVREIAPLSVRIMLTGNSDQQTALDAVNEGNIFRFLTKPCPPEVLAKTLEAGMEQYRLVTAEKELLENTLNSSLQVLVDILALVNPTAFSRASRLRQLARRVAASLDLPNLWEIEIAALLSQIGCVTVPEETLIKYANAQPLDKDELRMIYQYPLVGHDLLERIPRLETVAKIIAFQNFRHSEMGSESNRRSTPAVRIGAGILKLALDYDRLHEAGQSTRHVFQELTARTDWYDPLLLQTFRTVVEGGQGETYQKKSVKVQALKPGMLLEQPITTARGVLLVAKGQEVTPSLLIRLKNFADTGVIEDRFEVLIPIMLDEGTLPLE